MLAGDGTICRQTPAVGALLDQYSAMAMEGPLLCNVRFPTDGPGYVDDPTGSVSRSAAKQVGPPCQVCKHHPACSRLFISIR